MIGHGSVGQRRLLHGGRALRAGYVEGIGVRTDRRRRGHGTALMQALERVVLGAYKLGALGATDQACRTSTRRVAGSRGRGRPSALTPTGLLPAEEHDGSVNERASHALGGPGHHRSGVASCAA